MGESVKKKTSSNQNIKKKTSGTASTGNRKPSTKAQREQLLKEEERAKAFQVEVILWVIVAVSLLLFISNFGVGGVVGGAVSGFLFGLFGLLEYVFPIILLLVSFFVVSNHGNRIAFFKLAATLVFVIFLDVLIALVTSSGDTMPTAIQAFQECFQNKIGGGLVGGGIGWLLYLAFGKIGAYIVTIAVLIICFVLVTEKSAMRGIRQRSSRVYQAAKDNYDSAVSEKARKPRRMECKVRGVGDTTIEEDVAQPSDNMNELHLNSSVELSKTLEEKMSRMADPAPFEPKFAENPNVDEKSPGAEDLIRQMEDSFADSIPEPSIFQAPEEISEIVAEEPEVIEQTRRKPRSSEAEIQQSIAEVAEEIAGTTPVKEYVFPPLSLLKSTGKKKSGNSQNELRETAIKLQKTLQTFGVNVTVTDISCGPAVTRYEIQPEMGVKVSKIVNLADDIKLNLAAADIRIEAPIPGKAAVGIEVPNKENTMVSFRELIESKEFKESPSNITFAVGRDIAGNVKVADIAKMPHVLIAGATGSGKSVCINTIVMSILYKAKPEDVKMIMIDPKVVELSVYNGIPHLMIPVVTDPKKAAGALNWAVQEMLDRYDKFAEASVRKIDEYNAKIEKIQVPEGQEPPKKMPQLVIIVDELADLMMVASHEVEEAICRLAQLARAAGIHLVIATQRPSVNVITGLIKANMPSRIAFAVTSGIDSRTILDMNGAEKLLGKGDMLFNPQGVPKPLRVQGAFVSDEEVSAVVSFVSEQNGGAQYNSDVQQKMDTLQNSESQSVTISDVEPEDGRDAYFEEAGRIVVDKEKASIGMLQRYLKIGFNRAARIMDQLEEAGVVGPELGTKPRSVLMSSEDFQLFIDGNSQK